uniref:Hexosyltransferase n=1 Tax=Timema poppense TaxID=170557 RepID=A0A7R9DJ38_TIMPO|nr:unnamed protein product [Timema poppensis]
MANFNKRMAIRHSWGFEKRFSDVPIRTVFVLGVHESNKKLQFMVQDEQRKFGDIVQANFIDTYYNNTIKTLMGFNWAMRYCTNSRFYMFADDDMYISTKNVLRFLRNPTQYPKYLETPVIALPVHRSKQLKEFISENKDDKNVYSNYLSYNRKLNQVIDFELSDDVKLFAGFVFVSAPHRHRSSKWYVRLSEYPYHLWPPYVTAGAYILSHDALVDMYYGSLYTQHFRFDDIYLGLVAKKVDLEPFHCSEFYFYKKEYNVYSYRYVIASHGFSDPDELLRIWNEQRSAGNA